MFKLQRLEVTGFKSFADYTEIIFTGNGITAVVGPNGCGKSNVSDCISWVLGEQRAKSLRGGEMKDVIFQGSRNRKPSGMAEVVLHLIRDDDAVDPDEGELFDIDEALEEIDDRTVDVSLLEPDTAEAVAAETVHTNGASGLTGIAADAEVRGEEVQVALAAQAGTARIIEKPVKAKRHWRPRSVALDFAPGEAVAVTRRLYLSGESEYQLNGRTCRLRDIQDLFAGTGLSGAHYAIVEQGRIGQILSAKPSERRNLIEEAAGISKFRTRQRAAESRLESAKSNLSRVSDIITEIDKQANSLRRQAGKTRRFIALQEEFRGRLRELFAAEGRHYSALIEGLKAELETAVSNENEIAAKVAGCEAEFRSATEAARAAEETLAQLRRTQAESALDRDRADRERNYRTEQINALRARLEALRGEDSALAVRIRLAEAEIERLKQEEVQEGSEAEERRLVLETAEAEWKAKVAAARAIDDRVEEVRRSLLQHTAAAERFAELGHQLQLNSERMKERLSGLQSELARVDQAQIEHQAEADRLTAEIRAEHSKLEGLNTEKADLLAQTSEARERLAEADRVVARLKDEASSKKHRLETLRELEQKRAVYFPQVQGIFADRESHGVELLGVLADFISVDESAEHALEMLLGPYLQTILVRTAADADCLIRWANESRAGRISILVLGDLDPGSGRVQEKGDRVVDRIEAAPELKELLIAVLDREMLTIFTEDLGGEHVAPGSQAPVIGKGGELLIGGRLYVAGDGSSKGKNSSLLAFKRELSVLNKAIDKLSKEISVAEAEAAKYRSELADLEEKTVDLQSLIIKVERSLVGLEMQEKGNLQEIERGNRHRSVVTAEIEQLDQESETMRSRLAEAVAGGRSAEEMKERVSGELEEVLRELAAARAAAEEDAASVSEKRTRAATSAERRRSVQFAIKRLSDEREEIANRLAVHDLETRETVQRISELESSVNEIAARLSASAEEQAREEKELEGAVEGLRTARGRADEVSAELGELHRAAAEAINARSSVEVRQTEAVTELRNLNEKCVHELNAPLAEIADDVEVPAEYDLVSARTWVEEQRRRLEGFGAINMLAVEELADAEERLDFLTTQRQDIIDSIMSAEEALREIKIRSRVKFKEAFEAINENFTRFFGELFGGGRGEMTLLDAEDILEAGIEVVAQPPGKRLQNILLLSGGEKAMTAIALVLAIFKYRPSPFCLLDEVDAPLDDANVGRFVTKIAEMSEKTQFIVITHNKRTMEAARALYGVTMQEPGVSKIVSVKFD
jgi:chromosome segregation protein